jgi:hypothetical protein
MSVIPATWEAEMEGSWFKAGCCKKVSKTISQKTSQVWWLTSVVPATGGIGRKITF